LQNNGYSPDRCPLPEIVPGGPCDGSDIPNGKEYIDLEQIDHVLYGDYNSMYEIKYPTDINIRVKMR
jgi:hypothetical protein